MSLWIWGSAAILGIIIVIAVAMVMYYRKNPDKKRETDYYTFFVIGLTWLPLGIVFMTIGDYGSFFFIMGLVFITLGLTNKDKWPEDKKFWLKKKKR